MHAEIVNDTSTRPVLAYSPHPLQASRNRELIYAAFLPRETISAYLARTGVADKIGRRALVLEINGRRVPRALWHCTRPKPGTLINLCAAVHGGGGSGKNPIATIAMIALMVYAPQIAVGLGGTAAGTAAGLTTFGKILSVGVMAFGGLAVSSCLPPPKPTLTARCP